jgi:hypothetical protein
MKLFKNFLVGIIIGLLLGLWFGVNIGRDQPLYSNPFTDPVIQDKIKTSVGEGVEKAGSSIEKMGEDMKGRLQN